MGTPRQDRLTTIAPVAGEVKFQSCLMQDEPEAGTCFSHKKSLKEGFRMLGIDLSMEASEKLGLEQIRALVGASEEARSRK